MEFFGLFDGLSNLSLGGIIASVLAMVIWVLERTFGLPSVVSKMFYSILDRFIGDKIKNLKEINIIKETDVINHDIFNYIDYWIYSKVPTLQFSTEYRTVVFRKYLKILLQKHKSNLQDWIQSKNFEEMDNSKLWTSVLSVMNNIIHDYEI